MNAGVYVCELAPGDVTPMGTVTDVERVTDQHTTVVYDDEVTYRYGSALTVVTVLATKCRWIGLSPDGETECGDEAEVDFCPRHAAVARSYDFDEAVINQ